MGASEKLLNTFAGLDSYKGEWSPTVVRHLVKRTLFGATKKDIEYFLRMGFEASINELLATNYPEPTPPNQGL